LYAISNKISNAVKLETIVESMSVVALWTKIPIGCSHCC